MTCINCGKELTQQFTFQGVVICGDCFKMTSHFIQRTKKELTMLFLTYTDLLRVALVKGQLRPPKLPDGKEMPPEELQGAFERLYKEWCVKREELHANSPTQTKTSESQVQGLRRRENHPGRELPLGSGDQAVRGGRELRPLPQVQEDGPHDDHRDPSTTSAEVTSGVDQDTRR